MKLKPVSVCLIVAEALDLATTIVGSIALPQLWEGNPMKNMFGGGWIQIVALKVIATALMVFIIEGYEKLPIPTTKIGSITIFERKLPKIVWIVPIIAFIPVIWNVLVIILEIIS